MRNFLTAMGIAFITVIFAVMLCLSINSFTLNAEIKRITLGGLITIKGQPTGYNYWTGTNILECMTCHPKWDPNPKCTKTPTRIK